MFRRWTRKSNRDRVITLEEPSPSPAPQEIVLEPDVAPDVAPELVVEPDAVEAEPVVEAARDTAPRRWHRA